MTVIETERLVIREITQQDFKELDIICSDPEIMKFMGDGKPLSKEQTQRWIDVTLKNYKEKGFGVFAVIDKNSGVFIGYSGLVFSEQIKDYELIYALSKAFWGQGLATEIANQMVRFGFDSQHMKCIYASIDPKNKASQSILLKIGFTELCRMNDEFGLESIYYQKKK
ncbi:GNAT family N-acetyltransferase [Flavobacterium sp. NST-5]|uniref:GNAT family N-acetyltransferase n=1 Tax=Flavobacterium ichthyis TaxID=2698827 RepID=A0ABW9ZBW7_9FLAO|nr:GNAT family N-acetyltransferase [Flavobacterium ichthyis]NBL65606.1 GNAT family N-acetyltransferase [Flavobacterium ichthyis]